MTFDDVDAIVGKHSLTNSVRSRVIYDFVLSGNITDVLELGTAHGATACYVAAALQEKGGGSVRTVDKIPENNWEPDIHTLLDETGLGEFVTYVQVPRSYTWELMKLIEQQTNGNRCEPLYDFCFLDGAHTWDTDGLAFFLVEKLLRPGGWILFDDLAWTLASLEEEKNISIDAPEEEKHVQQVEKVFQLLVCQHPRFQNQRAREGWGWAQKKPDSEDDEAVSISSIDEVYARQGIMMDVLSIYRKIRRRDRRK